MTLARDLAAQVDSGTNLADILSSALPPDKRDCAVGQDSSKREEKSSDSSVSTVLTGLYTECSSLLFCLTSTPAYLRNVSIHLCF
jgi:hypothetical protein